MPLPKSKTNVRLTRSLRRAILQGHPWVYRDAVDAPKGITTATLARVTDTKGELAWAIYDPHSPLALRILSLDPAPPSTGNRHFERRFERALELRKTIRSPFTTGFRLFNGEGDLLPGLVCDVYGRVAVIQFDGQGPGEFWNRDLISNWLLENADVDIVVEKFRRSSGSEKPIEVLNSKTQSPPNLERVAIKEHGAQFEVDVVRGQKTGFFLDQRDNRFFVREFARGRTVLNLFSYTGGFSVSAGLGGAKHVTSVDISRGAIETADRCFVLNCLEASQHRGVAADVFEFLAEGKEKWDHVLVDPPSMTHAEEKKDVAVAKYIDVFKRAAARVNSQGALSLSSCSSHITFEDFFKITSEALSGARRTGQIVRVSGQGVDHPFPHACEELRYLKFFHLILN